MARWCLRARQHTDFLKPPLACSTANVKEDGTGVHSTQLPNGLVQQFCASGINLEEGIWRDADLQTQKIFKDVGFPKQELVGGLLMAATGHGARTE